MKQKFELKKLTSVCDIVSDSPKEFIGLKNYYSTGAINNEGDNIVPEEVSFLNRPSRANSYPRLNDIGFAKMKFTNKVIFVNSFFDGSIFSTGFCFLRPKNLLNSRYLYHFVISHLFQNIKDLYAGDGIMGGIKNSDVKEIQIPLPTLPEQQRIVAILDEAFAAIAKAKANAEQNLKNAKELFESFLQGVFENKGEGWKEKTLGELFDIGSSKRIMEKDWTVDGVPFYGGKEIVKLAKFGFVLSNNYISEDKYNEYASKYDMPQRGDILITARGTIGIGYIVKKGDKFYYKDGNIISMRAKIPTNPEFILYALKSKVIYDQFKKLTGATVSHLPIEKAKLLVLMVPNFSTQNTVVEKIQEIEAETKKLEAIYNQKIKDLEELKKSVLQKAFSGELKTNAVAV